jgi:peptidoglycan/xylan/chitin deacetylase (PgdA/CDA1 family)
MSEQPIYLTFDDGPDPNWTPQILAALEEAGMHATFFAIGELACREPELLRRVAAAGRCEGSQRRARASRISLSAAAWARPRVYGR